MGNWRSSTRVRNDHCLCPKFLDLSYREGGSLSLSRPGLGEKSATIDLGVEESSFGAVLFYLQEWEEAWDPAIWYEREDAPTLIDQTTDPNAREAWMTSAFGHAAAASATGLSN